MFGVFSYNNRKYEIQVGLSNSDAKEIKDGNCVMLLPENIGTIEYTNTLNDIVHSGSIEYTDTDQRVDKLLDKTFVYCSITFSELKDKGDGNIVDTKAETIMPIVFFVDNIGIEENEPGRVKYKLFLSSTTWMNCTRQIEYTNYGKKKENVFDIIQNILKIAEFNVDADSFNKVSTAAAMSYITNNNDDVITCMRYLLNKMYFSDEYGLDSSVKGIIYDEYNDLIRVVDTEKVNDFQKSIPVTVNQTKNDIDPVSNQKVNLAYNVKQDKSSLMESMVRTKLYSYSLDTNEFGKEEIGTNQILNYYSGHNRNSKVQTLPDDGKYSKSQMVWNNNINIYWDQMKNLTQYGSLILNTPGQIGLIPGWLVNVTIPIKDEVITDEDKNHQKEVKNSYQAMCGPWIASSVTNFINPNRKIFRQNISLMRNDKATSIK